MYFLVGVLLTITAPIGVYSYAINKNPIYSKWPGGVVPYRLNPGDYSAGEKTMIQSAMRQITSDSGGCIQWQDLDVGGGGNAGTNFVIISRNGGPGVPSPTCFSYSGMVTAQRGQGQYMSIQSGPNGCMANTRQIMRILAYLLELRPEHNKPNRDSYIAINPSALNNEVASIGLFNVIPDSTIIYSPSEFDYNSITLMDTNSYSSNGAPVVASKTARQIWNNGRLSQQDCYALHSIYGCQTPCSDVYGGGSAPQAGGAGGSSGGGGGSAGGGIGGGGSGGPSAGGSPAGQGNAVQIIYGQPAGGPANPPGGQYPAIPPTLPPAGTFSQLCSPAFIVDAAWNDYARGRIYFVSGSSVYAISNKDGQLVENGALLSTDFPNAPTSPAFAYYQAGLTTLVDKAGNSFLYQNGTFVSSSAGGYVGITGADAFGNTATSATSPMAAGIYFVDKGNNIVVNGVSGQSSPVPLSNVFGATPFLAKDLSAIGIKEIFSVMSGGQEKLAFLYQPTDGRPLQYFEAQPCSSSTLTNAQNQVCLTGSLPKNFADALSTCFGYTLPPPVLDFFNRPNKSPVNRPIVKLPSKRIKY